MKFSLRSFLIAIGVVGTTLGVMTRLLMESPETFFNVLRTGGTVGPFLLAVGTSIWIGVRGATPGRQLVLWGGTLLLLPVAMSVVLAFLPTGNPLRLLTTQRLIAQRLPSGVDQPWVWQELERRLAARELTMDQVDDAVAELTAHMRRTNPAGWNQPLPWQRVFLQSAILGGMISEPVYFVLCDAFFGPTPVIRVTTPSLNEDDTRIEMQVDYGTPWFGIHSGIDIALVWDVKQVLLDGSPVKLHKSHKPVAHRAAIQAETNLTPGEHTLVVEFDCAYGDISTLAGRNMDTLTLDQLPKARKRWETKVEVPVQVAPVEDADEEIENAE